MNTLSLLSKIDVRRTQFFPSWKSVGRAQLESVLRSSPSAMWGGLFNIIIAAIAHTESGAASRAMSWAIFASSITILVHRRRLQQLSAIDSEATDRQLREVIWTSALLAVPWAIFGIISMSSADPTQLIVVVALIVGMAASGASLLAPVYPAALVYLLIMLGTPLCIFVYNSEFFEFKLLAALTISFAVFLTGLVRSLSRASIDSSELNNELASTLAQIQEATRDFSAALPAFTATVSTQDHINRHPRKADTSPLPEDSSRTSYQGSLNAASAITILKNSAAALIEQDRQLTRLSQKLHDFIDFAGDGILGFNPDGRLFISNAAAKIMFELPDNSHMNFTLEEFQRNYFETDESDELATVIAKCLSDQKKDAVVEKVARSTRGREFAVEVSVAGYRQNDGQSIMLIVREIGERKRLERHFQMLMSEVCHRSRNLLAVVSSISFMTSLRASSLDDFTDQFSRRLQSLSIAHKIIADDDWSASSLKQLVQGQLLAHCDLGDSRLTISGPEVLLKPRAIQNVGLALHELATNAAKYGCLSTLDGKLSVRWRVANRKGDQYLVLIWRESGGPRVLQPATKGFGSLLLQDMVSSELDGQSVIKFRPTGVVWQATIRSDHFSGGDLAKASANAFTCTDKLPQLSAA